MAGLEFTKNQKLALIAIVGLIVIAVSIKLVRNANSPVYGGVTLTEAGANGVGVSASDSDSTGSSDTNGGKVVFQVAGCVKSPNVYTLPRGSRIVDAIRVAGGVKPGANLDSLNLAAKIEDGSRIFVPSPQSPAPGTMGNVTTTRSARAAATKDGSKSSTKSSATEKFHNPGDGVVHINSADATEMQRLPGVGPSTAQAIIDYRTQIGRFTDPDQLDDVKGIGPKKLEKMRPFIAL